MRAAGHPTKAHQLPIIGINPKKIQESILHLLVFGKSNQEGTKESQARPSQGWEQTETAWHSQRSREAGELPPAQSQMGPSPWSRAERQCHTLPTNAASRELEGLSSELSQNSELSSDATENWKSPAESHGEGHHRGTQGPWGRGLSPAASW